MTTTAKTSSDRARNRLGRKLKTSSEAARARKDATPAEKTEYTAFKVWMKQTLDSVRIAKKPKMQPPKKTPTAADKRASQLRDAVSVSNAAHQTGDPNHINVPMAALNKAAMAAELYAISRHIQGFVLISSRAGTSSYMQGARRAALELPDEERGQLIAMHTWINARLSRDMRAMSDVVIDQALQLKNAPPPTVSEVGENITRSDDERVRKGGVIGYYRAMFQTIMQLQREYMISHAVKQIEGKRR